MSLCVEGRPVELTNFEFRLLHLLMMNAGTVLSANTLADHIYDESADRESNVIQRFVYRVRRKIDPDDRHKPIESVYGAGYLFAPPRGRPK